MKLYFCLVLICTGFGLAAQSDGGIRQAKDLYYQGIYGDKEAGEKADHLFTELHQQRPDDVLISVYFGSLRLLEANHTWALWKKNSLSKQGVRVMDKAVQDSPDNLEVRFVRAATERNLPTFFGRKQQAADEFRFLAQHARQAAQEGTLEPRLAAASFFYYGEWCKEQSRDKDATEAWKDAAEIAPESHAGHAAADRLIQRSR